jgi:hypothetical protein
MKKTNEKIGSTNKKMEEGKDYYLENGYLVFTAKFLRDRGYCCLSGCRNCPYGFKKDQKTAPPRQ